MRYHIFVTGLFVHFIINLSCVQLRAQVLFEGYSKILYQGHKVGFSVQKYEFDTKQRQFNSVALTKYSGVFGNTLETLKAVASESMEPVSFSYQMESNLSTKSVEGTVKNRRLYVIVKTTSKANDGPQRVQSRKWDAEMPKGLFLSTFLGYTILRNPAGLKLKNRYEYSALSEETGEIITGAATVLSNETLKGLPVFKVRYDLPIREGKVIDSVVAYVTAKMEPLAAVMRTKSMSIELVSPQEAMNPVAVSMEKLKLLFGEIPTGRVNSLAEAGLSFGMEEFETVKASSVVGSKKAR